MATNDLGYALSPAARSLMATGGLGDVLQQQRETETDEIKRRRLVLEQMRQSVSPLGAPGAPGLGY
jgi:hypothetical protein